MEKIGFSWSGLKRSRLHFFYSLHSLHVFQIGLLILAGAAVLAARQTPAPSWPQFRQNSANTGVASTALPAALKLLWTYNAGQPIESTAAVVDDVAYVGTAGGELVAIDMASGKAKWKYQAVSADYGIGSSSPAVANGVVYVGDLQGVFHAVDAATGKVRWTHKTGSEIKSSPVIVDGKVLIGSYDGNLYAFEAASGKLAWKASTENYVHATPAIVNGIAYFGGCDEVFHGIRVSDGAQVVELRLDAYTAGSAATLNGIAYFGTFNNDVVAVDIAAKKVK